MTIVITMLLTGQVQRMVGKKYAVDDQPDFCGSGRDRNQAAALLKGAEGHADYETDETVTLYAERQSASNAVPENTA